MKSYLLAGLPLQLRIEVHGVPMEAFHVNPRVVRGGQPCGMPCRPGGEICLFQKDDVVLPCSLEGESHTNGSVFLSG